MRADEAAERLAIVKAWSLKIHGSPSLRHDWCMATARAMLARQPLPPSGPGTAFYRKATAEARRNTIAQLLGVER